MRLRSVVLAHAFAFPSHAAELPEDDKDFHEKFEHTLADEKAAEDAFDRSFRNKLGVLPGQVPDKNLVSEIEADNLKVKTDQKKFEDKFDSIVGFKGLAGKAEYKLKDTEAPLLAEMPASNAEQKKLQKLNAELAAVHKFTEKETKVFNQDLQNLAGDDEIDSSFVEMKPLPSSFAEVHAQMALARASQAAAKSLAEMSNSARSSGNGADDSKEAEAKVKGAPSLVQTKAQSEAEMLAASNKRVQLAAGNRPPTMLPVTDVIRALDKECFMDRCKAKMAACDQAEGACATRLACAENVLFGFAFPVNTMDPIAFEQKAETMKTGIPSDLVNHDARNCWKGVMWSDLHPHEKMLFGCAQHHGCYTEELPSESSFVELSEHVDAFEKGIEDLASLRKRFTDNEAKIKRIEQEQKEQWGAEDPAAASSFLQTAEKPTLADEGISGLESKLHELEVKMKAEAAHLEKGLREDEHEAQTSASSLLETSDENRAAAELNAQMLVRTQRKLAALKALVNQWNQVQMREGVLKAFLAFHPHPDDMPDQLFADEPGIAVKARGHIDFPKLFNDVKATVAEMKESATRLHHLAHADMPALSFAEVLKWESAPDYATYKTEVGEIEKQENARTKKTKQILDNLSTSIEGLSETPIAKLAYESKGLPPPAEYGADALGLAEADPDPILFHTQQDHLNQEEDELDSLPKPRSIGDPLPSDIFDEGPTARMKPIADIPVEDYLRDIPTSYAEVDSKAGIGQLRRAS